MVEDGGEQEGGLRGGQFFGRDTFDWETSRAQTEVVEEEE